MTTEIRCSRGSGAGWSVTGDDYSHRVRHLDGGVPGVAIHEPAPVPGDAPGPLLRLIHDQRIAFLLVGGFNTVFAFALFVGFHQLFGDSWWRNELALLCSNVLGILTAF